MYSLRAPTAIRKVFSLSGNSIQRSSPSGDGGVDSRSRSVCFLARLPQVFIEHQRRVPGRELSKNMTWQLAQLRTRAMASKTARSSASRATNASTAPTGSSACQVSSPDVERRGTGTGRAAARLMRRRVGELIDLTSAPDRAAEISSKIASRSFCASRSTKAPGRFIEPGPNGPNSLTHAASAAGSESSSVAPVVPRRRKVLMKSRQRRPVPCGKWESPAWITLPF